MQTPEAKLVEAQDALRSVLQRYKDLSHKRTPEWDVGREQPVKQAKSVLEDKYTEAVEDEFYLLRKLSRKVEKVVRLLGEVEEEVQQQSEALRSLQDVGSALEGMIEQHIELKSKQGIVRPND